MPLPANVTTVTVLGTFLTPEGDPSTGTVSFTPSSWLLNSGANIAIPNSSVVKTLGTAGDFSAVLPITDDPDLSPGGWVYSVSEVVDGVSQSYNIAIPGTVAAGGTVFLADLAPVAPAGPEYYSLASSLAIGTVSTVPTGGSATASITGLAPSQVLNLGIPTGATGTVASAGSGSVGTAAVAPQDDPDTGIYFPAANQVAITTGGSAAATFAAGAISNPTFTGVASFPDGSASAPSITNTGDTNTGIYFSAEDQVSVATNGSERVRVTSTGLRVRGYTSGPAVIITGPDDGATQTAIGLGITPGVNAATEPGAAIYGEEFDANDHRADLLFLTRNTNSDVAPTERVRISASGLVIIGNGFVNASPANGDLRGTSGSGTNVAGASLNISSGRGTGTGAGGNIGLFTAPAGSSGTSLNSDVERLRVDSNGLITGTGTSLGAFTAFTPTVAGGTWAIGNGTVAGVYCQIGKVIVWRASITFGSTSVFDATNALRIGGLPVNARATGVTSLSNTVNVLGRDVSAAAWYTLTTRPSANDAASVNLYVIGTNGAQSNVTASAPFTWADTDIIYISGVYEAV